MCGEVELHHERKHYALRTHCGAGVGCARVDGDGMEDFSLNSQSKKVLRLENIYSTSIILYGKLNLTLVYCTVPYVFRDLSTWRSHVPHKNAAGCGALCRMLLYSYCTCIEQQTHAEAEDVQNCSALAAIEVHVV